VVTIHDYRRTRIMKLKREDFTLMAPVEDEITPASFTDKIYPTEGIDIRVTHHFLQRWNQRLGNRSPDHLNQSIENKEVRYMCRGMDNSFHFLYRDQYDEFFVIIVGTTGGLKTILPEEYYRHQFDAANLSIGARKPLPFRGGDESENNC